MTQQVPREQQEPLQQQGPHQQQERQRQKKHHQQQKMPVTARRWALFVTSPHVQHFYLLKI
jgi:hypothetical protein